MVDSFYVGAYWSNRRETYAAVVKNTISFLDELVVMDPQFHGWYELGYSKKEALSRKFIYNEDLVESLYKKRIKKSDLDKDGFSKIGYSLGLWTGHKEYYSSGLSINAGHASKFFPNACVINMLVEGEGKKRLLETKKQKELFELLVRHWNPDSIILSSTRLKEHINTNEVGWMSYYKSINRIPLRAKSVKHEEFCDGHLFYLLARESYDYDLIEDLGIFSEELRRQIK